MKLDPISTQVSTWLKTINRDQLHEDGWIEINRRFHGIAMAMRPYLQQHFPEAADQEAAFDGLTLGLLTIIHFETIEHLSELLAHDSGHFEDGRLMLAPHRESGLQLPDPQPNPELDADAPA